MGVYIAVVRMNKHEKFIEIKCENVYYGYKERGVVMIAPAKK